MVIFIYRLDIDGKASFMDQLFGVPDDDDLGQFVERWLAAHHPIIHEDDLILATQAYGGVIGSWRVDVRRDVEVTRLS